MGMGGAYIAVGGTVDSLFYNPAGIARMPEDKGWEVDLINVSAEYGKNVQDFIDDLDDAANKKDGPDAGTDESDDQQRAVNDVLAAYRGKNLHFRLADFTAMGKAFEKWAFGLGGLGSLRMDAMTHQGFGPEGFLEMNADITYGGVGAFSMAINEKLTAGVGLKYLKRESIVHQFTITELIEKEDNLDDYITDDLRKSGSAVGLDAGVLYKFAQDSKLKPVVGASLMNLGDTDFDQAGEIPMTLNVGIAVHPEIRIFRSLTLAADYVDIMNAYNQDNDMGKRLRIGGELQLIDKLPFAAAVRAGLYEGYPTFGLDLRLLIINLSYVNYIEEVGAYAGQDKDRRQFLTLNIGW